MALNFPLNPTVGQQYEYPPYIYEWDGAKWQTLSAGSDPSQVLRDDLAANTGATLVGTSTGQTVQYELDNHTHTAAEVGALAVGGTAVAANKLSAQRSIALTGDATGSVLFDGSANVSITTVVVDDSHSHIIANVDTLQAALDAKLDTTGNAASATTAASAAKLTTARTITLTGDATSTAISFDGSANISIPVTVVDDLHNHTIANVDNLQAALDAKLDTTGNAATASSAAKLTTARTITLTGDATSTAISFDGSANISIPVTVVDDLHNHTIANVDTLQTTLDSKLPLAGGTMTGGLTFSQDNELGWVRNTDYAKIGFKNTGDSDADSYLYFKSGDNGNEYFKWQTVSGTTTTDLMTLQSDNLRIKGNQVYHEGFNPTAADVGAVPTSEGTSEYSRQVTPKHSSWGEQTDKFRTGSAAAPAGSGRAEFCNWIQWGHNGGQKLRHTLWCPADNSKPTELWFAHQNNTTDIDGPATHWRVYHQGFKPTASDVGLSYISQNAQGLRVTLNGKFVDIGCRNTSYCHMDTDATSGFYMYKNLDAPDVQIRSDRRLKSEFEPIENALSKVGNLTGQTYKKYGKREAGIIAQDLEQVLPEAVSEGEEGYLSIAPAGVNALLVEAIKELTVKLELIQKELNELKNIT